MPGVRTFLIFSVFLAMLPGCTEKKPEKIENPHKSLLADEIKPADKSTLLLFEAIEKKNIEYLKKNLSAKTDFGSHNKQGDTLLVFAAGKGNKEVMQALLQAGAPVNSFSSQGDTALLKAASEGRIEAVKLLLDAGADVNVRGRKTYLGAGPLFLASSIGSTEIVEILIKGGAFVDLANKQGITPLMDASYGSLTMVNLLLKHGANPTLRDENGMSAIKIAYKEEQKEILKALKVARNKYKKKIKKK